MYYVSTRDARHGDKFADWCAEHEVNTLLIGTADINGSWIGKLIPLTEFGEVLSSEGVAFSNAFATVAPDGTSPRQPSDDSTIYFPRGRGGGSEIFFPPLF